MTTPLISLCMIVRDEAAMLPDCLGSVAALVDELVIVDTGSRDATPAIAAAWGARVLHLPWQDDFAAARNFGLAAATGGWILIMDADDRLEPADLPKVRALAEAAERDAYLLRTISYVGDRPGGSSVSCPHIRLFRAEPGCRYVGRIHERLTMPPHFRLDYRPLRVYHHGYLTPAVQGKDKIQRNLRILQALLAEQPDDSFTLFNLGTEWVRLGEWDQAITAYSQALAIVQRQAGWAPELVKKLAIALVERRRHAEGLRLLQGGLRDYPDYTDLQYLLACLCHRVGRYSQALAAYRRCLEMGEAPGCYPTDDGAGSHLALLGAGLVHRDMGNHQQAADCFLAALGRRPDFGTPLPPLLGCLREWLGLAGALAFLKQHLELTPALYRKLAAAGLEQGEYALALRLQGRAGVPGNGADRLRRGHCYLGLGRLPLAMAEWQAVPPAAPESGEARRHLALAAWLADAAAPCPLHPDAGNAARLNLVVKLLECGQAGRVAATLLPLRASGPEEQLDVASTLMRLGAATLAAAWAESIDPAALPEEKRPELRQLAAAPALATGRHARAGQLLQQAITENPWSYVAYVSWARALLAQALSLRPGWPPVRHRRLRQLRLWNWRGANARPDRPLRHRPQ